MNKCMMISRIGFLQRSVGLLLTANYVGGQSLFSVAGLELCRFVSNRLNPLSLRCGEISEILKSSRVRNPAFSLLRAAVNVATQCATKILRQRAAQFLTR